MTPFMFSAFPSNPFTALRGSGIIQATAQPPSPAAPALEAPGWPLAAHPPEAPAPGPLESETLSCIFSARFPLSQAPVCGECGLAQGQS